MAVIGVTGYRGRLGSALVKRGCVPLNLDVTDRISIEGALADIRPDVVINCAAMSDVDGCEDDPVTAYKVNTYGVYNIASKFSGKFVQISTDYIFDGKLGRYKEVDQGNPLCTYGFTKYFAEVGLRQRKNNLIIRTTILYGGNRSKQSDFVTKIYNKLLGGQTAHCPDTAFGNPTYVDHLAEGILNAIQKDLTGIINIAGRDWISRYDLAKMIAKLSGFDSELIFRGDVYGTAQRPLLAGFDLTKARILGIPIYSVEDGLRAWLAERIYVE